MKNVGVIFGSRSTEHDISVLTAISTVINPLKLTDEYNPVPIYISKSGNWYSDEKLGEIDFFTSGGVGEKLKKFKKINLSLNGGLSLITPGLKDKETKIDIVFPSLHGTYGEDGSVMGILRMANVPFVGCDMAASAVAMDKVLTKEVAVAAGCASNKYVHFWANEFEQYKSNWLKKLNKLKYPLFVKPAHMGSSIGLNKVDKPEDLENALEVAFHYDDRVIVEEAVPNLIEVTLPIIGNDELTPALLEQPVLNQEGVFDFDTKYMGGGKKGGKKTGDSEAESGSQGYSIIPAKVSKDIYDRAVELGMKVYRAVGCQGYARIDMLIDSKAEQVYFNEINPMPGSLYVHNWRKAGMSNVALVEKLIDLAKERHAAQTALNTVFENSFLSQFDE